MLHLQKRGFSNQGICVLGKEIGTSISVLCTGNLEEKFSASFSTTFFFWRKGLTMYSRLAPDSGSSWLSFLNAGIKGVYHHAQLL
jgi:hypothetical protein